jgi:hypothetical protein
MWHFNGNGCHTRISTSTPSHTFAQLSLSQKPNTNCCWYNGTNTTTTNEAGVKYFIMRNMNLIIGLHVNLSSCVYLAYLLLLFLMFFFYFLVVVWNRISSRHTFFGWCRGNINSPYARNITEGAHTFRHYHQQAATIYVAI